MRFLTSRPAFLAIIATAAALSLAPDPAAAAEPEQRVARMVANLGAETLAERDAATEALRAFEDDLERLLPKAVDFDGLSPEQRIRLDGLLLERFIERPRGGLGVQFAPQAAGGVPLVRVLEKFPAAAHLQAGDVIRRVEGKSLLPLTTVEAQNALRRHIISHDPGEPLALEVVRDGETIQLGVPVGNYRDLGNAQAIGRREYEAAWTVRRQRLGLDLHQGPVLTPPASQAEWPQREEEADGERRPLRIGLVVGGRNGPLPPLTDDFRRTAGAGGNQPVLRVDGGRVRVDRTQAERLRIQIAQLENQRRQIVRVLENEDAIRDERQAARYRSRLDQIERLLAALEERLDWAER